MQLRLLALLFAAGVVATLDGCGDPTGSQFRLDTDEDSTLKVYAVNGTPATLPWGLSVRELALVRVDALFNFDLAFDIKSADSVTIYTVAAIASQLAQTRRVGLQPTSLLFDEATRAPTGGYVYDSSLTVGLGRTVFVDVFSPACSGGFVAPNIRAKIKVDSLDLSLRTLYLHGLSNPNCGFRTLVKGTPKD
jgi:hypothetical protein